ncbi:MAG: glycosyltransferase family 2 protein [Trichodesmium sp. MAG_R02]|jgi:glycosyltransferase involved in cell wall biosynthesis|nr:glycosyltransferase family 2 protein [Trichodesmium sp. MAG_R02]
MKFSLIVATKNRVSEIERFLSSLINQNYQNFEVIIVDQNPNDCLENIVKKYSQKFTLKHVKRTKQGTSGARNQGRLLAEGDIIAYPDDDCLYPPNFLHQVAHFFHKNSTWDGLTVRVMDIESDQDAFDYSLQESRKVDDLTGWSLGIGPSIILRSHLAQKIAFDEEMGPGATWVGGEDTDYLLRCLDSGANIYYDSQLFVKHPRPYRIYNYHQLIQREFTYGRGFGYLLKKRNVHNSIVYQQLWQPITLGIKYTLSGNFKYALPCPGMVIGRILGYWEGTKKFAVAK